MNKALISALVVTAIAGVIVAIYLNDPEGFNDTVDDLKDKASKKLGKAKIKLNRTEDDLEDVLG